MMTFLPRSCGQAGKRSDIEGALLDAVVVKSPFTFQAVVDGQPYGECVFKAPFIRLIFQVLAGLVPPSQVSGIAIFF
jgi:hypothetical protein